MPIFLPTGPFTRDQAESVIALYCNVTIEDELCHHFRLVIRNHGRMIWRAWNYEPDAGLWLNKFIESDGIPCSSSEIY
ncbi:DUF905 family protein [Lelliottia wanjuensis]|uniref:DUF905 family protein n=1 Tax=Lelliottia wanjuensis TaxID=3050585 RepID=A0AAP4FRR5_9ENTR|nr:MULTISPECIES: DUF905 family protein [unclassified Lelliottia]MDK9362943.1 DUF905 family protein [Lelliottia sp. V106_12]MDK9616572.1 DUF905 family protein [Lelliottia sp. V106_9]